MKKNEGFSLVELIVVVAIMAVLIGILAPAYLGYVEKTRKGTDENTVEEIRGAIEKALAGDIATYDYVAGLASGAFTFTDDQYIATYSATAYSASGANALQTALYETFGNKKVELKSKAYNGGSFTITVTMAGGSAFEVTSSAITAPTK